MKKIWEVASREPVSQLNELKARKKNTSAAAKTKKKRITVSERQNSERISDERTVNKLNIRLFKSFFNLTRKSSTGIQNIECIFHFQFNMCIVYI